MDNAKSIESDVQPNNFRSLAVGLGIFVTVLMVLSGFSSVLLVGGVSIAARSTTGSATNGPSQLATSTTHAPSISPTSPSMSSMAQRSEIASKYQQAAKSAGVPNKDFFPPNVMGPGAVQHGNVVTPLYNIAPAPMGIGDFGIVNTSGTPVGTVLNTSSIQGDMTLNSLNTLDLMNDGTDQVTFQLNTVVVNATIQNSSTGQFWIQNVPFYTTTTHILYMEDNVWNFSSLGAGLPPTTLTGTSPIDPHGSGGQFYYTSVEVGVVPMPFSIQLYNNVTVASPAVSPYKNYSTEVTFGFNVIKGGVSIKHGTFDTVFFNSTMTKAPAISPKYQINGQQCSAYHNTTSGFCLLLDAELMIGGPGGGSGTNVLSMNATMSLSTLNAAGNGWNLAQSAFGYGTDTGETSVGVGEWWTTTGTVNLEGGPSFLTPLWNASKVPTQGDMKVTGAVSPSNAFLFFNYGKTTNFKHSTAAWAPTPATGLATYNLPPGNYSVEALFSDYTPMMANLTTLIPTFAFSMTKNTALGITTPLFAGNNAQLANISTGGSGTLASPYMVENQQFNSIAPEFNQFNDYGFTVFPGLLIWGTTDYVDINSPAPFSMTYVAPWNVIGASDNLPLQVYNASHVSIWNGHGITGWFAPSTTFGLGFPAANVLFWNVTSSLIGDSTFINDGATPSIIVYNDASVTSNNTIWGNTIVSNMSAPASVPIGIGMFSAGNTIYNNIVDTYPTAYSPTSDIYDGAKVSYSDKWNVTVESALVVSVVNGYDLSGNILGYGWQGGNDWIDYTCAVPLPYDEGSYPYTSPGLISLGGDYAPINYPTPCAPSLSKYYNVTFSETGLTAGLGGPTGGAWTITVTNWTTGASFTATVMTPTTWFYLLAGSYNFTASTNVSGFFYAAAMGTTTVTKAATVSVPFEPIPSLTVAPTSGVTNNAYVGATDINFAVNTNATAGAATGVSAVFGIEAASGISGSGTNAGGTPCATANWFQVPLAIGSGSTVTNVLASIVNTTSLVNFCIPAGSTDLPYGGLMATITVSYMTANPMTGAMTAATLETITSNEFFHVLAVINGPTSGQVFQAGNVTISFGSIWPEASARSVIVTGPTGFSTVSVPIAAGAVSGNLTLSLSVPGTYTVKLASNDTLNVAHGYPQAYANVSTTFTVVQAPPNIVVIYNNTTTTKTTYVNSTVQPAGISVGALGAILIVVGIIVGALIGYLFLAPKNRGGKPSSPEPWSGPSSPGKP